ILLRRRKVWQTEIAFIFQNADVCVSYFFILSGFVMIIAYGNKSHVSAQRYFRNRFARIYPLYFLAILIMAFLEILKRKVAFTDLFLNIFMIQSWIPGKALTVNPPGWSLSVELLFYAVFPFLFNRFFKKTSLRRISLCIILFWVLSQVIFQLFFFLYEGSQFNTFKDILKYNPLMHLNEFFIGNLAGLFFIGNLQEKKGNYDFAIITLVGLVILALRFPLGLNFHNGFLALFFIPLILLISLNNGYITKLFQRKAFVFLGEISFGIYILQHPVYSLISAYSVNKYLHLNDPTIVFFIRLLILIVFSAVVYICIEKPILEKVKGKKKRLTLSEN
ncbi:MAG: acyltransferase, partial [Flavobacterium sp.]